jgi:integrase
MSRIKITRKDKFLIAEQIFKLLEEFINDSTAGRRTKKDGGRISSGTIINYVYLQKYLQEFEQSISYDLKIYVESNLTYNEKLAASRYYKKIYNDFSGFLYTKKGFFDNYVGLVIKGLRSFFNYLENEKMITVGKYHQSFFVPREEIPIIALSHEQLNFIIYNSEFNKQVEKSGLKKVRDTFVFGCTVALRVSDLLQLTKKNLVITNNSYYLKVKSQKTGTYTSIKLPEYAVEIIMKYSKNRVKLLPEMTAQWFNQRLKLLAKLIPDDFEMVKIRERKGKQVVVYKNQAKKIHFKLSDHITTHTMRRTAITTMLNLGMAEHIVRKISGHAANSKEFFRYVRMSQNIIDQESDKIFEQIRTFKNVEPNNLDKILL